MEPDNVEQRKPSVREQTIIDISNLMLELRNLPYGEENLDEKRGLHTRLVALANSEELDDLERRKALESIHRAYEYSLMTKEEAEASGEKRYLVAD